MSIYSLERDGDADELRRLLVDSSSPAVRERAAEALGEVAEEEDDMAAAIAGVLVEAAIGDDDAEVRATAVDAIDAIGGEARRRFFRELGGVDLEPDDDLPVQVLVDGLDHEMPEVRMAAANTIGHEGAAEAVPTLVSALGDEDTRVRIRAARAAGRVGDPRTVRPLCTVASGAPPRFRRVVAEALGEIGGEEALDALEPFLSDGHEEVRREAVHALGSFEHCQPVDRLVGHFTDGVDEIRRAAALGIVDLLSKAPEADSHDLRSAVVEALSTTHEGPVVEALVELFEESTKAHRRRNAAWLLGRVSADQDAAVDTLVAALADDDEMVRQFAATSLVEMDAPGVESALLEALDTTFGEGRAMMIFVLGKIGSEQARTRLLELLDDVEDAEVQERTLAALSRLGGI